MEDCMINPPEEDLWQDDDYYEEEEKPEYWEQNYDESAFLAFLALCEGALV